MEYYHKKARYFIYNSKNLNTLDSFSSSSNINVMIINAQAFNARGADARRIYESLDEFQSRRPIDVILAPKVDVKKIRDCDEFTYLADGYLYYSDIEDNVCTNCKDGLYKFHNFENLKGNRYEIYRCSDCGKEIRIRCK